ncbi:universal stress protein [Sphingomonas sp. RB3P16]|uniref:universal stress protein n=1 Tax=Parasphingomonas frigoris TaxID=3096163 RepID=UPI002FCBA073
MKSVLLLAHDDAGQEARFQAAVDIVRALGGHLTCLDVAIMPPQVGAAFGSDISALLLADEVASETANRTRLEARLAHEDVAWDWIDAGGAVAPCVQDAARLADLIVLNRRLNGFAMPELAEAASTLIVKAGKPILAVPQNLVRFDLTHALVAWDGSPPAAAALRAAVPLLRLAQTVTLLEVAAEEITHPTEEGAAYLSRYDVHASVVRTARAGRPVAECILEQARHAAAGYIVMGGFGHLRLVEALLGGTTRTLLEHSPLPLFLAH